ncbi:MAG: RluA family pseudouridine synthase [Gammaproteobacteria bacterium]|nr:RluA family pseudouridine synthase [Gammaproteobacteria bacterium]
MGQATEVRYITVANEYAGQRIDNYLARILKGVPKSLLYGLLRRGEVRVNKGRVRQHRRLEQGDVVRIPPLQVAPERVHRLPHWLEHRLRGATLFEDDRLWIINKPSGVAVHGGSGESTGLIEALRLMRGDLPYLELVHRLDKETSGCLLLAKRRSTLRAAHEALRERHAEKTYLALVAGKWPAHLRRVQAPLQKNVLRSGERVVKVHEHGKASRTDFSIMQATPQATLLQAKPVTGRTHQIRVHCAASEHPVAGDLKYGDYKVNAKMADLGLNRLFLHSHTLKLKALGVDVKAPLAAVLTEVLERLGLHGG